MTREKMKERYDRAKEAMEKAKAEMEKYGHDMEEADKNDLWRTAQKHHIAAEDLARLIALKEKENAALLKRAEERKAEAAPAGAEKEENKNDSK